MFVCAEILVKVGASVAHSHSRLGPSEGTRFLVIKTKPGTLARDQVQIAFRLIGTVHHRRRMHFSDMKWTNAGKNA